MTLVSLHVFVVDLCREEPALLHTQPALGPFLLMLTELCGQETLRADQVQGQVSESCRMYKHRKIKVMNT